jgi:integrase
MALKAEKRRQVQLERAFAGLPTENRSNRASTVKDLLKAYQNGYRVNHRLKSIAWVKERAVHVARLLGGILMSDVTEERIRSYMEVRLQEAAGRRTVNMELECLSRAIGRTWRELWPRVKRLEEPTDAGRALSDQEELALLEAAAKSRSRFIAPFLRLALLTAMRYNEIRTLTWAQVDFEARTITVGRAKTEAGAGRMIPMNADLFGTLSMYGSWYARALNGIRPEWYVFPFSSRVKPTDATRPTTTVKTAWEAVRKAAGVACRFHDLRHTTLTKLAEAGVPESTMLALAGHMSRAMLERYSHIRLKAKREAVDTLKLADRGQSHVKESTKVRPSLQVM